MVGNNILIGMTNLSKKRNRINAILMFAIFLLLDISYNNSISEMYDYMGFRIENISLNKNIFSYLLALLTIYVVNFKSLSNFGKIILQLLAVLLLFPSIIMYKNANTSPQIVLAHLLFFGTAYYFLRYLKFRIKSKTIKPNQKLIFLFILSLLLIIPFIITYRTNVNLENFLLIDIYETRAMQKSYSNPYLGYVYSWLGRVIIPIALIFSIHAKSKIKSVSLVFLLAYLFLIGAHKSVLLTSIVLIIFYYIPKERIGIYISIGILFFVVMGEIIFEVTQNYYLSGLLTRRIFFVPAVLDTYYFDFFKDKPLYWSYSIFESFIDYPYESKPSNLIAYTYLGSKEMSSNNGIISDGYSNFGWIGIIINITIMSFLFSFFNSLRISHRFIGVFLILVSVVVSSTLPTLLLTHGGIVLILISQFFLVDTELESY